jgi:hypothetical protein
MVRLERLVNPDLLPIIHLLSYSLFVFKPTADSVSHALEIQCVFPITDKFSVTISIAGTQQSDVSASLERPRTGGSHTFQSLYMVMFIRSIGLNLLISSGSENSPEPLTVLAYDVQQVRQLLGECKRFKELYCEFYYPVPSFSA